jgi:hypothetical protein
MTRDEVFPSKYLKTADLKGKPRIVTIERAPYETLKGLDGKENPRVVLYFENVAKSLPLNATNFDAVCNATGCPDTEDWPGQQIELYPTKTTMGGSRWIASASDRLPVHDRHERHHRRHRPRLSVK